MRSRNDELKFDCLSGCGQIDYHDFERKNGEMSLIFKCKRCGRERTVYLY